MHITLRRHLLKCEIGFSGIFRGITHGYIIFIMYQQMLHNYSTKLYYKITTCFAAETFTTFTAQNCCHPEETVFLEASRSFPVTRFRSRMLGRDTVLR